MSNWLIDVESKGKVGFNTGCLKTHDDAVKYANRNYMSGLERDTFVAGWNMAYWDESYSKNN